ncbi:MAG: ATP-binding cassette domain-containing protein [Lachnospiraceae bacterium]|nr:ATP-binding cassette domain-containing protein [Lachnospiraceae bacterium]MCI8826303.1 ATP-binding cassette domain-containing protein [Lachnospiraceae bacterium]MCI9370748.1 ATP-binding cassette domain-containing protein [Lachnospiraceae bacterium]
MSLEVRNLVKKYGEKTVVNNLSFHMETPGVYALLGTNGAGKTTTLRIMLGMLAFDSGEVLWNQKPLNPMKVNLGYLAEERGLYPKYTLIDQLLYFAKLKNVPKEEAKKRIRYWAQRLEVEEYIYAQPQAKGKKKPKEKTADQLSKGNQQKIQLMAALLSEPELIVLDEPLSGLDPVNSDLFKSIIKELMEKDIYLIMSSHQMETIEEFSSNITILNRGNAVLQGDLNEIKKSYGRVNMIVKCDDDIEEYIKLFNLNVMKRTPDGYHIKVTGEQQAMQFLAKLTEQKVSIVRFELREPSLHEIFVEKVGTANE